MKNRDIIILKKILDYCSQVEEACHMFDCIRRPESKGERDPMERMVWYPG